MTIKLNIISLSLFGLMACSQPEIKVRKIEPNQASSEMIELQKNVLKQSELIKNDTLLQIQLALIDWSIAYPIEVEEASEIDQSIMGGYMIVKTHIMEFVHERGVDTTAFLRTFKKFNPDFTNLQKLNQ